MASLTGHQRVSSDETSQWLNNNFPRELDETATHRGHCSHGYGGRLALANQPGRARQSSPFRATDTLRDEWPGGDRVR